ncbi:MAG: thiamine phosphate synthase [Kiritimatiellae bacterium]|nr:thiamine phosphate synthase [Kiritimatiellia bacterium]MDD5520613.1 thiamine phosphate synthase [Kiritimatiellia bacterium]
MQRFLDAGIYLVTSEDMSAGRRTIEIIQAALAGGISLVQLREKHLSPQDFMKLAVEARKLTTDAGALLIINDNLEVAQSVGADGVHLGQADFPVREARLMTPDLIIGASTHSVQEAVKAQDDGASYVNIGPLFPTKTKKWDAKFLGMDGLKEISAVVKIPFTVMGGIKKRHIPELRAAGVRTVAVVTEITAADNPEQAARDLLSLFN